MTKILISYSRKDSAIARKLMEEFKSFDLEVWVDWEDIPPAVGWPAASMPPNGHPSLKMSHIESCVRICLFHSF